MAVSEQRIQTEPLVRDDVTPYAGAWIAVRDGYIVASALDPIELRDTPGVLETDTLMPVPTQGLGTFIL